MIVLRNGRGTLLSVVAVGLALVLAGLALSPAAALAAEELKIALVVPLSGRWARQGQLKKMGAEMAIEEINAQGGIRALGGARIVLREADAGDTVEKAVSAAQRVLGREKISAGIGAWLSSFTLGVTEVAERLQVPWFTLSYADSITERGFKYTFQTSPVGGLQAAQALDLFLSLAKAHRTEVKKAAIVGDNTAASVFFFKPLREKLLREKGIELVVDEIWTPPLADGTPVVQKIRSAQPDVMFFSATALPDSIQVLQKMKEFGVRLPIMGNGVWLLMPETVQAVGKDLIEGVMSSVGAHPLKGQEPLVERFKKRTGEPFMVQDSLMAYVHVWIIKEAAELAKSTDPRAIRDAVGRLDLTSGPATALVPGRIRYDERGRRVGATTIIVQWQGGEPFTVAPAEFAMRKPLWPSAR
ncbi:MAG TPA: ABC transporter substrate-binding protein [Dehalococcoidia bacterium]|nr:ABC transporter substrate-binding protein [Dehalococcoidia bacterium]